MDDAIQQVKSNVALPQGYRADWGGEYTEYTASRAQLSVILPLTVFLIFFLLFLLYNNFKFPFITVLGVLLSAPVGGLFALWITGTPFSASSGIGFLALFGVSVQTLVYISYVNELRLSGTRCQAIRQAPSCGCARSYDGAGGGVSLLPRHSHGRGNHSNGRLPWSSSAPVFAARSAFI